MADHHSTPTLSRRGWLQAFGSASAWACAPLAWHGTLAAAGRLTAQSPRFLLVFLRGGYDALSLLVPAGAQAAYYREVRPNIAIVERPATAAAGVSRAALPLTDDWGLHPALSSTLAPLVALGQGRFIPYAGTDDTSRSHFETQDSIELGQALGGRRDFGSGFLNRLATVLGAGSVATGEAIAFTDQLPLVMRGEQRIANLSLKTEPRAGDEKFRATLAAMYEGHPLQARVAESFEVRREAARQLATPAAQAAAGPTRMPEGAAAARMDAGSMAAGSLANSMGSGMGGGMATGVAGEWVAANRGAINARGFELEARRIGRLMRERYALGFVDIGGWDTHVGQGHSSGYLAGRLEELGRGLSAYADEIGAAAWRSTTVVVLSEFGRTVRENGNRGTDHGHGSVHWVLGGGLAAGAPVAGEQVALQASTLFQNRDLPVLNEYRGVLGGLLGRQFGLTPAQVDQVFPGAAPRDLRLL